MRTVNRKDWPETLLNARHEGSKERLVNVKVIRECQKSKWEKTICSEKVDEGIQVSRRVV
jgi:hypothetical protein